MGFQFRDKFYQIARFLFFNQINLPLNIYKFNFI